MLPCQRNNIKSKQLANDVPKLCPYIARDGATTTFNVSHAFIINCTFQYESSLRREKRFQRPRKLLQREHGRRSLMDCVNDNLSDGCYTVVLQHYSNSTFALKKRKLSACGEFSSSVYVYLFAADMQHLHTSAVCGNETRSCQSDDCSPRENNRQLLIDFKPLEIGHIPS